MPKLVTQEERRLTREAIYEHTVKLIKAKGVRGITVDDITQAVGIGKGSFYSYYPSREACIFEAIMRCERELISRLEVVSSSSYSPKESAIQLLREIFIVEDSLAISVNTTDVEALLRKLPAEYRKSENEKIESNLQKGMRLLKLDEREMEVLALLTDCLSYAASNKLYSQTGTKEALDIIINAISGFITKKEERKYE